MEKQVINPISYQVILSNSHLNDCLILYRRICNDKLTYLIEKNREVIFEDSHLYVTLLMYQTEVLNWFLNVA